ncbi:MAG: transcriptional regulator, TetR family [Acidimicrobiia bacterium]|nr:transcriptional regulator, TetR family [Acidimicrobiia bacterium]
MMSSEPTVLRRASYGPQSPTVGTRGARTRAHIVDAARQLFAATGFHAASVEAIAEAAGTSRATLYQYFESKEQIFLELLHESGEAQRQVLREMRPLGPTEAGFANLCHWLSAWDRVYATYATTFVQCASVDSPAAPLRPMIDRWVESYQADIAQRLSEMPIADIDAVSLANACWSILERYSYYRQFPSLHLDPQAALNNLAVVMQLMLFPTTPSRLLLIGGRVGSVLNHRNPAPVVAGGEAPWYPDQSKFTPLRRQSRQTLQQLLDAGNRAFTAHGYHRCSVDQIVAEAGLTRRTFYKYFDSKQDLLLALVRDCAATIVADSAAFADLSHPFDGDSVRVWLAHFLRLHRQHQGVFRVWSENVPEQPLLLAAGLAGSTAALRSLADVLARFPRSYALDPMAAALMLFGLVERFPERSASGRPQSDDDVVDLMMALVERGFLNPGTPD